MSSGKIVKWYKKAGDEIAPGDILCDVETDKATVPFEMLDKGFVAKILLEGETEVKVGEPVVVVVSKKDSIAAFAGFSAGGATEAPKPEATEKKQVTESAPQKKA